MKKAIVALARRLAVIMHRMWAGGRRVVPDGGAVVQEAGAGEMNEFKPFEGETRGRPRP